MMGIMVSSIVMPWGKHRKTLEELQEVILEYLASDDYSTDPHKHFSDIVKYGYSTLEEFISEIPTNVMTDVIIGRGIDTNPATQIGMRYVHVNETWKRGSLVKLLILPTGNMAIIKTDASITPNRNIFQKMFTVMSYFMFPPLFLLKVFRQYYMLTESSHQFECNFEELQLEKEHLLAYLRRNETGNHNHLVQVHLHGTPKAGQPLPPRQSSDQIMSNFEPQLVEDDFSKPQTKTKKKRKHKATSTIGKAVNEAKSQIGTNGFNEIGGASLASKTDKFPVSGVSQVDKKFEKLAPVGLQRGIEGAYNSCYMDSMLFSMFYTTNIFDFLLVPKSTDSKFSRKTRRILRERVVAPLREIYFCDYESLYVLRQHLSRLNEDLLGSFMDAEQVLYLLCDEVFKEQNFIQYAGVDEDGWGDYMHLMSIDAGDPSKVITVQRNLETSFAFNGNIRMASVPNPAFILGMPRSDRELIHYEAVIPNTEIAIGHLLQNAECNFCHGNADWEVQNGSLDEEGPSICGLSFCNACVTSVYEDAGVSQSNKKIVSRKKMKLVAIVCIRGVHFTAFVRSGGGRGESMQGNARTVDAFETSGEPWYFFDSMAGSSSEVKVVSKLEMWLNEMANDPQQFHAKRNIPALVKRSLTDGHLCIYEPICYDGKI